MSALETIAAPIRTWIDVVAREATAAISKVNAQDSVDLIENESGDLVLHGTSKPLFRSNGEALEFVPGKGREQQLQDVRVRMMLSDRHFLVRPLHLPKEALELVSGIVQAQIDRLAPWSLAEVAYGWSEPIEKDGGIFVMVYASSRALVQSYVQALKNAGARSIEIFVTQLTSDGSAQTVRIWQEQIQGDLNLRRVRRMFGIVLAAFAISAVMAQGVAMTLGADAEDQRAAVSQRIVVLRKGLVARSTDDAEIGPVEQLIRLKNASPSMVLILEALANVLPDDTYVNEFRFEADKVRISGITKDAPVLIELLEDSGQFRQATFVAPVIKAEKGNYFQLEISTRAFGAVKS